MELEPLVLTPARGSRSTPQAVSTRTQSRTTRTTTNTTDGHDDEHDELEGSEEPDEADVASDLDAGDEEDAD